MRRTPKASAVEAGGRLDRFSRRLNQPFLLGVYLLANAVDDLYLLVDGPDCILHKAEFIHGKHDGQSTLLDAAGRHRIVFSNVTVHDVAGDWRKRFGAVLERVRSGSGCGAVLVSAMPVCAVTGFPYERFSAGAGAPGGKPVLVLPPDSLAGDWLDGYAAALAALARGLPLERTRRRPSGRRPRTAVVAGALVDRVEGDQRGNARELRRLLGCLGLELAASWPDAGGTCRLLGRAAEADLVISLPYGREAGRILAERTKARLVAAPLPFGFAGTEAFLRAVAEACGARARAEETIRRERARLFPLLEWVLPRALLHREVSFFLDPHLAAGMLRLAPELGLRVRAAVAAGRRGHAEREGAVPEGLLFEPRRAELERILGAPGDLLVGSSFAAEDESLRGDPAVVELGFPSWHSHALTDVPFLGFSGIAALVERMANALDAARLREARRP